jgi:hypothetical protein
MKKKNPEKDIRTTVKGAKTSPKITGKEILKTPDILTKKQDLEKKVEVPYSQENHKTDKALVYLIGETPMVEQYAEICLAHGYDVCVSWNEPRTEEQNTLAPGIKISSTVPKNTSIAIELTKH